MTKTGKSKESQKHNDKMNLRKRFEHMFSGESEPVSHLSISQVEVLQTRLEELEAKLEQQTPLTSAQTTAPLHHETIPAKPIVTPINNIGSSTPTTASHFKPGQSSIFMRVWDRLTRTHPSIVEAVAHQQAKLSTSISLGFGVFTFIGLLGSLQANNGFSITASFLLIITLLVFVSYFINRSRYYKLGSLFLVISLITSGYVLAIINTGHASSSLYTTIPVGLIISSLLLPMWGLTVLTGINFLLTLLLPTFLHNYSSATSDAGIFLTIGILLIIAVAFRNVIERLRLAEITEANQELQSMQGALEKRILDRTHDLELASKVGRTVANKLADQQEMLTEAAEMIRESFSLYHTQVYLVDAANQKLILRAGTGEAGRALLERGHRLQIDSGSLNGQAALERKPVIVADTSDNPSFLPNPLLPNTRSEMVVPLIAGEQVLGVLDMQSEQPGALNELNLPAFQALAGQLAISIQNAGLYAESRRARRELEAQFHRLAEEGWKDYLNSIERGERIGFRYDQLQAMTLEEFDDSQSSSAMSVPISFSGAEIGKILSSQENRTWTDQELQVLNATAAQLAEHLENLRLLAQAESYRNQAEEVTRRLTREGWSELQAQNEASQGYLYNLNEVKSLSQKINGSSNSAVKHQLVVRDEPIGELAAEIDENSEQAAMTIAAVAEQLSMHIETLRLADELQQRAAELQELDRLKTAFLANMSHELRTPLNSILGFSEVILEELDGPLTDTMRNDLQLIQKNGSHLLHLINDVLDMAKIEAGKMNFSPEKFSVQDILEDVVNITSPQANTKKISLAIDEDSDHQIEIVADRTRISQVLLNVVTNSIKFTDQGSVSLRVDCEGENALICIRDTGEGIPTDKLESIFQEFTQVDTSATRKVGGTGLGLPISRRLIEMHGGRMWAESTGAGAGQGSVFFVELPLISKITDSIEVHERLS